MAYILQTADGTKVPFSDCPSAEEILDLAATTAAPTGTEDLEIYFFCHPTNHLVSGSSKFTWDTENNDYDFELEDVMDQGIGINFETSLGRWVARWKN